MDYFIHPTAEVSPKSKIGQGTKIWHYSQIRENVEIGQNCIIGKNVYIDNRVTIGDNCKIQNNSNIYGNAIIEEGVFIGPNSILTNDKNPRAISLNGHLKNAEDWAKGLIVIRKGASLGAATVVLPDIEIGKYAMIGAGSLVSKNIAPFSLAYGNPVEIKGKVDKSGKITERES
ncbi:N-acetyltransferase [Candidatus Micrarchaeota archaeon]|nr:N-acetyltransferase [Candidatus Micrarchaeota archaeon]